MTSLRTRLTIGVGAVVASCLVVSSVVLYLGVSRELRRQFDANLVSEAESFASMAEDGPAWDFEYASVSDFETTTRPAYFEVWQTGGATLGRSGSLKEGHLPHEPALSVPRFFELQLPDGRNGRAVVLERASRNDKPGLTGRPVTAEVARSTEDADTDLTRLATLLALITLVGSALGGLAGAWLVARGLRPLSSIGDRLSKMGVDDLKTPLELTKLPTELLPLVERLNDALKRLGASFERERRFTSDVSHELRTPLAALRLTLEVTASADRGTAEYKAALQDAIGSVVQLETLAVSLLTLARLDAGQLELRSEAVSLRELADTSWRAYSAEAARRRLTFSNRLSESAVVQTDGAKLKVILDTLLSNAASHTAEGGAIVLEGGGAGEWLEVWDSGPEIAPELWPRLFERFFRGDSARSSPEHNGIGLSIAQAMATALALEIAGDNARGGVRFTVHPKIRNS